MESLDHEFYMNIVSILMLSYWSEMTLNYRVMVEGYPNLKEEVGGLNPGWYELS